MSYNINKNKTASKIGKNLLKNLKNDLLCKINRKTPNKILNFYRKIHKFTLGFENIS